jgi:hypothetical protein
VVVLNPTQKGQLTKARKLTTASLRKQAVRRVFSAVMPREQAKHATRKFLAA